MGKEYKQPLPDFSGGIVFDFGNGAFLSLISQKIKLHDGAVSPGVLVAFRNTGGSVYAYDTEKLNFPSLLATLKYNMQ